jgi:hypothetical protein
VSDERWIKEDNERPFTKYPRLKPIVYNTRAKVFGTPPTWEALFESIKAGKTDDPCFNWMRKLLKKYSDNEVWEFYELWTQGKVHPKIEIVAK